MDISKLKRDPKAINSNLIKTPTGQIKAKEDMYIHVPSIYLDRELAFLNGKDKQLLGVMALICGDAYSVLRVPNLFNISPLDHVRVTINDVEYLEIFFPAGSTVFKTASVIVNDAVVYDIYDLYTDTNIDPWFLTALDRAALLDETAFYIKSSYGANRNVMKVVWAFTMRQPHDRTKYFRTSLLTQSDWDTKKPVYIPFKSVIFGPKTTTAKFNGAYFDLARAAALVNPSEKSDDMEKILRL